MVIADLPTPPPPTTTILKLVMLDFPAILSLVRLVKLFWSDLKIFWTIFFVVKLLYKKGAGSCTLRLLFPTVGLVILVCYLKKKRKMCKLIHFRIMHKELNAIEKQAKNSLSNDYNEDVFICHKSIVNIILFLDTLSNLIWILYLSLWRHSWSVSWLLMSFQV